MRNSQAKSSKIRGAAIVGAAIVLVPALLALQSRRAFSQHFIDRGEFSVGYGHSLSSGEGHSYFGEKFRFKGNTFFVSSRFGNKRTQIGMRVQQNINTDKVHAHDLRPDSYNVSSNLYYSEQVVMTPTFTILFPWCSATVGVGFAAANELLKKGLLGSEILAKTGMVGYFNGQAWTSSDNSGSFIFEVEAQYSAVKKINLWPNGSSVTAAISYSTPTFTFSGKEANITFGLGAGASETAYANEAEHVAERINTARPDGFSPISAANRYSWIFGGRLKAALGRISLQLQSYFSPADKSAGMLKSPNASMNVEEVDLGVFNYSTITVSASLGKKGK